MASNISDAMVQALQEVEQAREILADYRGISTDNVNLVEDLNHMFLTVKIQSDELGMIDYNGYKAELARLRGELATLAKERDEAIEALRLVDSLKLPTYGKVSIQAGTVIFEAPLPAVWVAWVSTLVTAHDEARRADGDVMLNPEANG